MSLMSWSLGGRRALSGLGLALIVALVAGFALVGRATAESPVTFRVTITNTTSPEMVVTPGAYLLHKDVGAFWSAGSEANLSLERIAEIGDSGEAVASLGATALDAAPANGDAVTFEVVATPGYRLSLAQMLVASNDGFIGVNSLPLFSGAQPTNGTFNLIAWDAGTEANAPLFGGFEAGQPDPAMGAANVDNGTATSDPVAASDQFNGAQATLYITPLTEWVDVPAGLSAVGWTGSPTTSAAILSANSDIDRIFYFDVVSGSYLADSTVLPSSLRVLIEIERGDSFFVVASTATTIAVDLAGPTTATARTSLTLSLDGLETLSSGHYEGWAIFGDDKLSTGKFNIGSGGGLETLGGGAITSFDGDADLTGADAIVLTIEPDGDVDDEPSGIVVLSGSLNGTSASLAFGASFASASGSYILATPTNDPTGNETGGIWFLDPSDGSAGLSLPTLPDGWVYESWGVTQGVPLSGGRFTDVATTDMGAPFSGPNAGPPFPGEDFVANLPSGITPPVDLADGASAVVVSVEPDLDGEDPTGAGPFAIKPLVHDVPEGLADHTSTEMDLNLASVPSGTAMIE